MASSYFEVKETANDESVLPFGLEACEENGILTSQLDGDMAKDHTYTKEPDIVLDRSDDTSENLNDVVETNKPTGRSQRNVKPHKFIKSGSTKEKETKSKKDTAAKKVAAKASKKAVAKQPKQSPTKKDVINNKKDKSSTIEQNTNEDKVDNVTVAEASDKSKRRTAQKRKVEEKENIAEEQPPSSDVALIENNTILKNAENSKKSKRKSTAEPVESPKKRKVTKEREVVKKAKAKTVKSDADGVMVDSVGLPTGWLRKVVVRKTGKTAGQLDVYIYSPDGLKFRSKPDIASYLARTKSNLKLENFNFSRQITGESKSKSAKTPVKKETAPVAKSKNKEIADKKSASSTPSKKGPKLVVKLKFMGARKNATGTNKTVAVGSSAKKSNATKSGSGQKSNRKKKSA